MAVHLFQVINFAAEVQSYPGFREIIFVPGAPYPVGSHMGEARLDAAQSTNASAADVADLDVELKHDAQYMFEYALIYSISGLAVGAQFGVSLASGDLVSIGYSILMAADGSSLRSAATTTAGALIGSGSSFSGGGPWTCIVRGALKTGSTPTAKARLAFKGSGIGVSVTLQPNSTAWFQEV